MFKFAFLTIDKEGTLQINNKKNSNLFLTRTNTASLLFDDIIFFNFIRYDDIEYIDDIKNINEDVIIFFAGIGKITEEHFYNISNLFFKTILFDLASNDMIYYNNYFPLIEKYFCNKKYCIITKSLDYKKFKNTFFYDQQLTRMTGWLFNIDNHNKNTIFSEKIKSPTQDAYNLLENLRNKNHLLPSYKGLYLIGHARMHKIELLEYLYKNNLLNSFIWASGGKHFEYEGGWVKNKNLKKYNTFEVLNLIPKKMDYGYEESDNPLVAIGTSVNWSFYMDVCYEVVAETEFYNTEARDENLVHHISEKTIKSILMNVPFITMNLTNTIQKLEENFGFKFNNLIKEFNHDYDFLENDGDRMNQIQKKIYNLNSYSNKQLNNLKIEYKIKSQENVNILYEIFWRKSVKDIYNFIIQ